jgi:hypothetical protein
MVCLSVCLSVEHSIRSAVTPHRAEGFLIGGGRLVDRKLLMEERREKCVFVESFILCRSPHNADKNNNNNVVDNNNDDNDDDIDADDDSRDNNT